MELVIEHRLHRAGGSPRRTRSAARVARTMSAAVSLVLLVACGSDGPGSPASESPSTSASSPPGEHGGDGTTMGAEDRAVAQLATAGFQDIGTAEAAGYASTIDTLGCFQDADRGGMGVHYLNGDLMDDTVDLRAPEALVYEMDRSGDIVGLVAHEYIVPVEAWTADSPPELGGVAFHRHPTLPLWVLHTWLWKDNAAGFYADWNPAVRQCPDGVPVFGIDLPAP